MPKFDWQDARRATILADGEMLKEIIWLDTDKREFEQYVLAPVGQPFILSFNAKAKLSLKFGSLSPAKCQKRQAKCLSH